MPIPVRFVVPAAGVLAVLALPYLAACTSLDRPRAEAEDRVAHEIEAHLGTAMDAEALGAGLSGDEVDALLADGVSMDDAVRLCLLHAPDLGAELAKVGVAAADLVQAGLFSNPVLSLDVRFRGDGTELEGLLAKPFLDVFTRAARRRAAIADQRDVEAHLLRTVIANVFDARRAVVELAATERLLAEVETAAKAEAAGVQLMQELYQAGNVPRDELSRLQVSEARARLLLASTRARAGEAHAALALRMGLEPERDWALTVNWDELASPPEATADASERALSNNVALAESAAHVDSLAEHAGIARVSVFSEGLSGGLSFTREAGSGEWGFGPGGSIPIPLLDTGAARGRAALARLEGAFAEHQALRRHVQSAALRFAGRVQAFSEELSILTEGELPAADRLVEDTLHQYNAMQIGVFEVIDARARELDATRRRVETERLLALATCDLEELLAGNLNDARLEAGPASASESLSVSTTGTDAMMGGHQ